MGIQTDLLNSIPIDELTGAISVPIYQTSTFVQDAPGVNKGFDYSRSNNPTRKVLENLLAKLENGTNGFAFSSGLAAIDAVIKLLEAGDEIIAVKDIYGGTFRLFEKVYSKFGLKVHYVDFTDIEEIENAINANTKLFWVETPTNPTLKIADLSEIGHLAKSNNILLCVDNTFSTPIIHQPINYGADIVVHSVTKYLSGHSDVIAGAVVTATEELGAKIKFHQNATGAVLGPFDSWLVIRGIETLPFRVRIHSENALKVAQYLEQQYWVKTVYYPGLTSHPQHKLAKRQQKYFGGIIAFDLQDDDKSLALEVIRSFRQFHLAESLGGIKSLCCLPCEMSHKAIPEEIRTGSGVSNSLIRLSVGLEDIEDLINDLKSVNRLFNKEELI